MKRNDRIIIFFICMSVMMFLCSCEKKTSSQKSADQFVERTIKSFLHERPVETQIQIMQPVLYTSSNLRDPFESPVNDNPIQIYPDTILKNVALDSLKLVGIITRDKQKWAILRDNKGQLFRITIGTRIGMQQSLLTQIDQNQVKFTQEVNTSSGIQSDTVVMQLLEPSK